MQAKRREFAGAADIQAMGALARAFPSDNLHVVDLPYRFSSWAMDDPENVGLWADAGGQLVAWAVMQTAFWTIDYACHPHAGPELHRQILDWADQRARQALGTSNGRPCWFVMVLAGQADRAGQVYRIRDLEAAGFACQANVGEDSWSKVLMARTAQTPNPTGKLPAGFAIRPLAGESEVEAYVEPHRAVFESRNMTAEWRARTLRCPEYVPDLDLVAVAPDGRLAAFCVCWLDRTAEEASGQIEPLGVRSDLLHLGLGRAMLAEGLRRLHLLGAQRVYVETDSHRNPALRLYESAGFRVLQDVLVYRKDYEGA
jgi:ribosomal protein S18 acetylase RimI-like enzyme